MQPVPLQASHNTGLCVVPVAVVDEAQAQLDRGSEQAMSNALQQEDGEEQSPNED